MAAKHESERISGSVKRAQRRMREKGRWLGTRRPFGYQLGGEYGLEIDEAEAELVREAARRLLAGEGQRGIARDWNARGIRTTMGREWSVQAVHDVMSAPRIAGLRRPQPQPGEGRRQKLQNTDGLTEAGWQPILDRATYEKLLQLFSRRYRPPAGRKWLLSGLATCAKCGTPMQGTVYNKTTRGYRCHTPSADGCGGVYVNGEESDTHITKAIISLLRKPSIRKAIIAATRTKESDEEDATAALAEAEERLARLGELYATVPIRSSARDGQRVARREFSSGPG